ncbi:RNA polymerase sigma-70 factor [Parapedobacter sp. SGR-10]|uniref:RNA polymerase sigma factor n=1 Tax=Parapedobacter sp. SGR-10 TaxID=2710879 RepID=UPI0013D2FFAD|nr:RNA polymerase sigma-70 factor [Parapedobacter sp. SGR-10]NGF57366.1 RNA polymerase sigma-70 factor [Parapedobacter sp. SGR-10]
MDRLETLATKIKNGDHHAFMEVYDLYFYQLSVFVKRYVHSESIAEDLTQDVFVKLWEKREFLDKVTNFNSYLYRIAKNHTLDYLKKISRLEIMPDDLLKEFKFSSNEVELFVTEQEYFRFLDNYMKSLPEKSQVIFDLCREQEKSYDEVAKELNISKSTVKHHMVNTMKRLKDEIIHKFRIDRFHFILFVVLWKIFLP